MSEIDPSFVRPMEVHLLKICENVIKLKYDENATNTKHKQNCCTFLLEEMKEENEIFEQLFESVVPAGSYPDNLKIKEPNEYDELIVLNFPKARLRPSRPGYVTINIKDGIREGWNIGKENYDLFIDEKGYLIQNKVLAWFRDVVRETLNQHDNVLNTDLGSYEIYQKSNGPAVTLDIEVLYENIQFSVDFVACLAFHSDDKWISDVKGVSGVWHAIPKPIKLDEKNQYLKAEFSKIVEEAQKIASSVRAKVPALESNGKVPKTIVSKNENASGKVKKPPSFWYKMRVLRRAKVSENVETPAIDFPSKNEINRVVTSGAGYRRMKKPEVHPTTKVLWEKPTTNEKATNGGSRFRKPGTWYRKSKKSNVGEKIPVDLQAKRTSVNKPANDIQHVKWEKSTVNANPKASNGRNSTNRKFHKAGDASVTKKKAGDLRRQKKDSIYVPDPDNNREWTCSYTDIERELLRGTDTMKPLIRIFKKIRDKKKLTNLKSFYIKTMFIHQNAKTDVDYWKQSLAVLFMEMLDVILDHLLEHKLNSFWHRDLNLFSKLRPGQTRAIYENLLKIKDDLIENLEDENDEFIYEVVCDEEERMMFFP